MLEDVTMEVYLSEWNCKKAYDWVLICMNIKEIEKCASNSILMQKTQIKTNPNWVKLQYAIVMTGQN